MPFETVNDLFPSKYLKADDVEEEELTLTMKEVRQEKMGPEDGEGEIKGVLFFNETEKGLVLNVTNANTIKELYGKNFVKDWPGKKIVLFWAETAYKGEMKPCIRVHTRVK